MILDIDKVNVIELPTKRCVMVVFEYTFKGTKYTCDAKEIDCRYTFLSKEDLIYNRKVWFLNDIERQIARQYGVETLDVIVEEAYKKLPPAQFEYNERYQVPYFPQITPIVSNLAKPTGEVKVLEIIFVKKGFANGSIGWQFESIS